MISSLPLARPYVTLAAVLMSLLFTLALYAWQVDQAAWEVSIVRWLQESGIPGLRPLSIGLAVAGTGLPWAILIGVLGLALWAMVGVRAFALLLLVAVLQDVGAVIKLVVERARPSEGSVEVWRQISSHSFPSGHVLGATLVFGFLIFALEHCALGLRLKRALQATCLAWIALMGLGRMELGAHWPTDVLGGYIVGALLLLPAIAVLRRSHA